MRLLSVLRLPCRENSVSGVFQFSCAITGLIAANGREHPFTARPFGAPFLEAVPTKFVGQRNTSAVLDARQAHAFRSRPGDFAKNLFINTSAFAPKL
jgi:hypothetical protein